jgi:hypothetical protein
LAANVTGAPTLETVIVCGAGGALLMGCVNDRDVGETASVALGVIFNVTLIVCGLLATFGVVAVIVTVPV